MKGAIEIDLVNTYLTVTFNNLDPNKKYTVAVSYNRDNPPYTDRATRFTISGADTYTNSSSAGVIVNSEDSVSFCTGINKTNGYVAMWTGVNSSNGMFSITAQQDKSRPEWQGSKGYTMTAVMLQQIGPAPIIAPTIITHPDNQTVTEGQTATFTLVASGSQLSYQWKKLISSTWQPVSGATDSSYTTPVTSLSDDQTNFRCQVTNSIGSVISNIALLTVEQASARVDSNLLVLYAFDEGTNSTCHDISGVGQPLDLTIQDPAAVTWLQGGGLEINAPTIIKSDLMAEKVIDSCKNTNEMTVEAWLAPANTTQDGPARIITISSDPYYRDFTLGQGLWSWRPSNLYDVRLRTNLTSYNGTPSLSTPAGSLTTELTHVVFTCDSAGNASIYLNAQLAENSTGGGALYPWQDYLLALGNEINGNRPWLGRFYLVAIFDRALTEPEIIQNFTAGPYMTPAAPIIVTQPANKTVTEGQTATFTLIASGSQLSYQWEKLISSSWQPVSGATEPSYTTPATTLADDQTSFRCLVTNTQGSVTSDTAVLTVIPPSDRVTSGLLALYLFDEGSDSTCHDVSGVGQPLNLTIQDPSAVNWIDSAGLQINSPTIIKSDSMAAKIVEGCMSTNELTIEAWISPANTTQDGPARIITLSADHYYRNFTLGQGLWGSWPSDLYDVR